MNPFHIYICPLKYLGMRIFHHKTRKNKFRIGIPVILFLQIAFAVILIHH